MSSSSASSTSITVQSAHPSHEAGPTDHEVIIQAGGISNPEDTKRALEEMNKLQEFALKLWENELQAQADRELLNKLIRSLEKQVEANKNLRAARQKEKYLLENIEALCNHAKFKTLVMELLPDGPLNMRLKTLLFTKLLKEVPEANQTLKNKLETAVKFWNAGGFQWKQQLANENKTRESKEAQVRAQVPAPAEGEPAAHAAEAGLTVLAQARQASEEAKREVARAQGQLEAGTPFLRSLDALLQRQSLNQAQAQAKTPVVKLTVLKANAPEKDIKLWLTYTATNLRTVVSADDRRRLLTGALMYYPAAASVISGPDTTSTLSGDLKMIASMLGVAESADKLSWLENFVTQLESESLEKFRNRVFEHITADNLLMLPSVLAKHLFTEEEAKTRSPKTMLKYILSKLNDRTKTYIKRNQPNWLEPGGTPSLEEFNLFLRDSQVNEQVKPATQEELTAPHPPLRPFLDFTDQNVVEAAPPSKKRQAEDNEQGANFYQDKQAKAVRGRVRGGGLRNP